MKESESLRDRLIKLLQIFRESFDNDDHDFHVPEEHLEEFDYLVRSIEDELLSNPGELIYIEDETDLTAIRAMIGLIWRMLDYDEMLEKATFVTDESNLYEYCDNLRGDFVSRLRDIRPTVISVDPGVEIRKYYSEAVRAWLHGLDVSALLLGFSIIEETLRAELAKIDPDFAYNWVKYAGIPKPDKNKSAIELIDKACIEKIIGYEHKEKAHRIRTLRNEALHDLRRIDAKESYQAILDTKDLIEKIFSESKYY